MFEPELYVRCLKEDEALVKEIIPDCIQAFHYKMEMELGRRYPLELRIDSSNHLKKWTDNNALLSKNEEMNFCIGGVIITNASKDIVYKNTLDCRLSILQEMSLPEVRYEIWRDRS
jgi:vacuolar-type H+-ATPase subunit E/Vma4